MPRTALWTAIADTLRAEIGTGHYGPGDRLPTEADLAARFGVNRHTLRRALAALAEDGLVQSRRGSGVFVTRRPTDYALGPRVRFHRNLEAQGRVPGRRLLSVVTRAADVREARALGLRPEEPVHVAEGLSLADGQPIAVFRSVFPAERMPDLPSTLAEESSVTRALARHGVPDYTRADTRLCAVAATVTQALHLGLREGAPLLRSEGVNVDSRGDPVEFGTTWFAGDRVTLTLGALPDDISA